MTDETRELNRVIDRRNRWRTAGSLVVAFVAFAALAFSATQWATRAEQQQQRAEQEQGARKEAETAVEALCAQVEQLGRRCVVEPEELTGEPIPPTEAQLRPLVQQYVDEWLGDNPPADGRTPTADEIVALVTPIVAAELERNPPPAGEDGETPTVEQIRPIVVEVVAAHLFENPPPPGEDGQDGADGAPGADSTVPGPPGEPPLSWTSTTRDVLGEPTTHRCERVDDFDPDAPRYECTEQEEGP